MDYKNGCGCGIIEPDGDSLESARDNAAQAKRLRELIATMERQADRHEEQARRYFGGGMSCDTCEGMGGFSTPGSFDGPAGVSGWEECPECDGFGVTRALTCDDHDKQD
jgi:DnaJ-class molecular chaperone